MLESLRSTIVAPFAAAKATLWTDAVPEQRKLTVQLARNTTFFAASCVVIRFLGDALAV
jgi:hypothetical protein